MESFLKNKEGICPACGESNLEYGEMVLDEDNLFFPYKCDNCGTKGEEWYHLDFSGHRFYDENGAEKDLRG